MIVGWMFARSVPAPELTEFGKETGQTLVERSGTSVGTTGRIRLQTGDLVRIGEGHTGLIAFRGESTRIVVRAGTEFKVLGWMNGKRFELHYGTIEASVSHQPKTRPMTWHTAQAEATVLGTEFLLENSDKSTKLAVQEGTVELRAISTGRSTRVSSRQVATVSAEGEVQLQQFEGGRGSILRQYWLNVAGVHVGDLTHQDTYPARPSGHDYVGTLCGVTNSGIDFGERMLGYLHAPKSGTYRFWLTASDSAQLLLSSDETREHAVLVASVSQAVGASEWDRFPWQKSEAIRLEAGRKYFVELLHKAGSGNGKHCSVAWEGPGFSRQVVPAAFLSPPILGETK
jgi:hypothetical protein